MANLCPPLSLSSTEAEKTAQIREAGLEMELHQCRIAATTERYRAEQFSLAVVEVSLAPLPSLPTLLDAPTPLEYTPIRYCTFHSSPSAVQTEISNKRSDALLYQRQREAEGIQLIAAAKGTAATTMIEVVRGRPATPAGPTRTLSSDHTLG